MTPSPEGPMLTVKLRPQDADAILALAEWVLNHPELNMGPGLHPHGAEEACRRIESVADLHRRGIQPDGALKQRGVEPKVTLADVLALIDALPRYIAVSQPKDGTDRFGPGGPNLWECVYVPALKEQIKALAERADCPNCRTAPCMCGEPWQTTPSPEGSSPPGHGGGIA